MVHEYICVRCAQIFPIAQPLVFRKFFELNIKLFKFRMRAKKVVVTFVVMLFFLKFPWDIFTVFIPSEFGMLV